MKENYKQILPKWFEEQKRNDLVLSDDLDSLVSCAILNKVKGWKVRYFYDFRNLYKSNKINFNKDSRVWVDVAALNGEKAFDNHVSMVTLDEVNTNDLMINPNKFCMITNENYTDKYCGSTALLLWSLYDLPLPETEEGKMLLLAIDSTFKGYYSGRFRERNKFFLCDVFGMEELYKVEQRHTQDEFTEVLIKYETNRKITFADGKLYTLLDFDKIGKALGLELNVLEDDEFVLWTKYQIEEKKITRERKVSDISKDIFSLAFTYRSSVRYSREVPDDEWLWDGLDIE